MNFDENPKLISLRESRLGNLRLKFSSKIRFLTILKFFRIHEKNNCWLVLGVARKSRSQEMSIFEVFEHLKIYKIF